MRYPKTESVDSFYVGAGESDLRTNNELMADLCIAASVLYRQYPDSDDVSRARRDVALDAISNLLESWNSALCGLADGIESEERHDSHTVR